VSNLSKPSILGKRVIVEPLDAAGLKYTTGSKLGSTEDDGFSPAHDLPQDDLRDSQRKGSQRQGSEYEEGEYRRCRQRVTFTGVTPTCNKPKDENIEDCIVIANTIQVEIMDGAEPTGIEGMQSTPQQDESNLETDA